MSLEQQGRVGDNRRRLAGPSLPSTFVSHKCFLPPFLAPAAQCISTPRFGFFPQFYTLQVSTSHPAEHQTTVFKIHTVYGR
jgi:hypothetical protein